MEADAAREEQWEETHGEGMAPVSSPMMTLHRIPLPQAMHTRVLNAMLMKSE